jgi:hypothetical protein
MSSMQSPRISRGGRELLSIYPIPKRTGSRAQVAQARSAETSPGSSPESPDAMTKVATAVLGCLKEAGPRSRKSSVTKISIQPSKMSPSKKVERDEKQMEGTYLRRKNKPMQFHLNGKSMFPKSPEPTLSKFPEPILPGGFAWLDPNRVPGKKEKGEPSTPPLSKQVSVEARINWLFDKVKCVPGGSARLRDWIKRMPKIELHIHGTGAIAPQTWIQLAGELNLFFEPASCKFYQHQNRISARELSSGYHKYKARLLEKDPLVPLEHHIRNNAYFDLDLLEFHKEQVVRIPAKELELEKNEKYVKEFQDLASMRACTKGSEAGYWHFFNAFDYIWSVAQHLPLERRITLVVEDAIAHNVKHIEPMIELLVETVPKRFKDCFKADDESTYLPALKILKEDGWPDKYVNEQMINLKACNKSVELALGCNSITNPKGMIDVSYVLEVMRTLEDDKFFLNIFCAMALAEKVPDLVGGLNVVGPEHNLFAINHFDVQMRIISFLRKQFRDPNIALHSGELNGKLAAPRNFTNHISGSIAAGAKRISHAVSLRYERDQKKLLEYMRENGILVEICWNSNEDILNVTADEHPLHTFLTQGIPVAYCSDDPGVTCQTISDGIMSVFETFKLNYSQIKTSMLDAAEASFIPTARKTELVAQMSKLLDTFEDSIMKECDEEDYRGVKLYEAILKEARRSGMPDSLSPEAGYGAGVLDSKRRDS